MHYCIVLSCINTKILMMDRSPSGAYQTFSTSELILIRSRSKVLTHESWRTDYLIYLSIYLWLYSPLLNLGHFFNFVILYTVGRTPWTGDQPVARCLPTQRTTQTQNKRTHTSIPWVGFEPTIPAFERAKTVHALDSAAGHCGTVDKTKCSETSPFRTVLGRWWFGLGDNQSCRNDNREWE
jgi:hypothetical protein